MSAPSYQPLSNEDEGVQLSPVAQQPNMVYGQHLAQEQPIAAIPIQQQQQQQVHVPIQQAPVLALPVAAAPVAGQVNAGGSAEELDLLLSQRYVVFSTKNYYSQAYNFFKHNAWSLVFATLIVGAFSLAATIIVSVVFKKTHPRSWHGEGDEDDEPERPTFAGSVALWVVEWLTRVFLSGPISAGFLFTVFEALRLNRYVLIKDMFACYKRPYFPRLVLFLTVHFLLLRVGFALFIIPGLVFAFFSLFAMPMHQEYSLRSFQAIRFSFKLVCKYPSLLGFFFLSGLLQIVGVLCCFIGVFVTIPVALVAFCFAYHHLVGIKGVAPMVLDPAAPLLQAQAQVVPVVAIPVAHAANPAPAHLYPAQAAGFPAAQAQAVPVARPVAGPMSAPGNYI